MSGINTRRYNPFSASAEELLVAALDESGLLDANSTVNGRKAEQVLHSYFRKRSLYREFTKLGRLLVEQGVLEPRDLQKAFSLQKSRSSMKLGEALIELGICSIDEIEKNLETQLQIRKGMEDMESFRKKIDAIRERLRKYF